jgi:carbon monoxide dehydrogenase subunit G
MKITNQFEVSKPLSVVWDFLQDVPTVAQCLPGAELTEDKGGGVYLGRVSAKLGPLSASFEGEATVEADVASHSATIKGKGVDKRGGSRGRMSVVYRLSEADGGTAVDIQADVNLAGAAAQFGRSGLIREISNRLIGEFAECLEAKLSAVTVEEADAVQAGEVKGLQLFFQTLGSRIKGLFSRS